MFECDQLTAFICSKCNSIFVCACLSLFFSSCISGLPEGVAFKRRARRSGYFVTLCTGTCSKNRLELLFLLYGIYHSYMCAVKCITHYHKKRIKIHSAQNGIFHLRDFEEYPQQFLFLFEILQQETRAPLPCAVAFESVQHSLRLEKDPSQINLYQIFVAGYPLRNKQF